MSDQMKLSPPPVEATTDYYWGGGVPFLRCYFSHAEHPPYFPTPTLSPLMSSMGDGQKPPQAVRRQNQSIASLLWCPATASRAVINPRLLPAFFSMPLSFLVNLLCDVFIFRLFPCIFFSPAWCSNHCCRNMCPAGALGNCSWSRTLLPPGSDLLK